jgi:hypothetical protein
MVNLFILAASALTLCGVAAMLWRRAGVIGPRERLLYDIITVTCVLILCGRGQVELGLHLFAGPLSKFDQAILFAALPVSFVVGARRYAGQKELQNISPLIGRYTIPLYMWINFLYFLLGYVYLTKSVEGLLNLLSVAPDWPMLALRAGVFVAVVVYGICSIISMIRSHVRALESDLKI